MLTPNHPEWVFTIKLPTDPMNIGRICKFLAEGLKVFVHKDHAVTITHNGVATTTTNEEKKVDDLAPKPTAGPAPEA